MTLQSFENLFQLYSTHCIPIPSAFLLHSYCIPIVFLGTYSYCIPIPIVFLLTSSTYSTHDAAQPLPRLRELAETGYSAEGGAVDRGCSGLG